MSPKNLFAGALLPLFIITLLLTGDITAQSKKSKAANKESAKKTSVKSDKSSSKKTAAKSKDTKKAAASAKNNKKTAKETRASKEKDKKKDKLTAKEKAKEKERSKADRGKRDQKGSAERNQAAAERRRKDAERRAAVLAERRRKAEAAREARARRIAFERGLRTETVANIANDVTEGEDLAIRKAAISALGTHAGSVVVMEAQTGKILTVVNQDWALRSSIKPCSTIKLVTGVAGLNEGVVSKETGAIKDRRTRRNLDDAIAFSDNGYFQVIGSEIGNSKMIEYARQLGLGQPTGINTEGETAGKLAIGNNNARIYSHGDDFEVSTLQLAVMVSAIANGGKRVIPRVPRNSVEKTQFQTFYKQKVDVPQVNVRRVIPGMMGAAEYGTARRGVDASLGIAGKTGSCISKGSWVGLFASVAPIENPKYSVAVITRGERERGKYAAAVAGQVYRALSSRIVRTDRNLAQTEFHLQPRFPARVPVPAVEDEDDDDSTGGDQVTLAADRQNDTEGRDVIVVPSASQPVYVPNAAPKKLVVKTGQSRPKFPPVVITYDKENAPQH
jgi:hypothetical protein